MDREALNDYPMGKYDVTVIITRFEPDTEIERTISGTIQPPLRHLYGYRLEPREAGTLVTSYYDWSEIDREVPRGRHLPGDPVQRIWRDSATAAGTRSCSPSSAMRSTARRCSASRKRSPPWYRPRPVSAGGPADDGQACSPEFPAPTSFRQWCEEVLRPAVQA